MGQREYKVERWEIKAKQFVCYDEIELETLQWVDLRNLHNHLWSW